MDQVFTGARIFDGTRIFEHGALRVVDGRVAEIGPERVLGDGAHGERVELDGGILSPGFVDLQVNGGGGAMLGADAGVDEIATICAAHGRLGTTGLLPTLITDTPEVTRAVIKAGVAAAEAGVPGFLGLHLEGPHIDPRRKGAHDPALIRPMEAEDLAMLLDAAARLPALVLTLAPESATHAQIAALSAAGAVVSVGHSDTGAEAARQAFRAGARMVTHLFNAMSPLGHREPGLVGAALDSAETYVGLIADGVHVAPEVMRIALAGKRGDGLMFLVTDAMAVAGTDLAEFRLGDRRILRRDGSLTLEDGTLAGADCDMARCLRVLTAEAGVEEVEALQMATCVPAACIGLAGRRGCLIPGAPADLVHLSDGMDVRGAWRAGASIGEST
jgi:N-acetylglucosamine-6-phosphate deacetylase